MDPIQIADGIYWVGAIDWNIRDFHGYSTNEGSTYNAYLILDEKVTLIDTVKKDFVDEFILNISKVIDPKRISQVISNHTEMDHSGGLARVMHKIGEDKPLICSEMGKKNLSQHYSRMWNYRPVKNGETLNLGKRTLSFLETRMLHWPDSMFTYCNEDHILFSSDAFGQHFASLERFDDQVGDAIMPHAAKYFANILLPYSNLILKLIKQVTDMRIDLDMICPDHGIIWRKDPMKIINAYEDWARQKPRRKAVVVYDTMWHSTEKMAEMIVETLGNAGVISKPMHLRQWHRSDVMTEVLDAAAVVVGSPTLNNGMFPTMSDFLCYMKGLKPQNKIAAAFGSYGWSGEAVKQINQQLTEMRFNVIDSGIRTQYVPDKDALAACAALGKQLADQMPK